MLKVGDKIRITDGSYTYGVKHGKFDTYHGLQKKPLIVIETNLQTIISDGMKTCNKTPAIADILVTDNAGNFWFTPSRFTKRVFIHTVTFDNGAAITISDESYEALKSQLS